MGQKLTSFSEKLSLFFNSYKTPLIMTVVLIVVGLVSYGIYSYAQSVEANKVAEKAYEFEESVVKDYADKKLSNEEVQKRLADLLISKKKESFPAILSLSDKMLEAKAYKDAASVLQMAYDALKDIDPYLDWILMEKLSYAYEASGDFSTARSVSYEILNLSTNIRIEKTYLDIGRLSLKLGDKEKAKESFEYIINELPSGDYTKIAGVYLDELDN